jgi:hypothetical protein
MKSFRWRIVLSTVNLAAAIMLSTLGAREYQEFRGLHPFASYEGNFLYIPPAQLVSDCVNAPAFVASNLVGNTRMWKALSGGRGASALFYVGLVLLWCWIGWRIDIRSRRNNVKAKAAPFWVVGGLLSVLLAYAGIQIFLIYRSDGMPGGRAVAVSMFVWGAALLCYCGEMLINW